MTNSSDDWHRWATFFIVAALPLFLGLSGCGSSSPATQVPAATGSSPNGNTADVARELCASSNCGSKTALVTIPDAENILFTPNGRLFVSGGTNVFEIVDSNGTFEAIPLFNGSGNFLGLGQRGNTLYANEFSGSLYAATITDSPQLSKIYDYSNVSLPNGMAIDREGSLFTVDGPVTGFPPSPKIVKLRFDPNNPMSVTEQTVWLDESLQFANGLAYNGSAMFVTDSNAVGELGSVRRIAINNDGSAGAVTTLFTGTGVLDDLSVVGNKLLVSDFQNGLISLIDRNGNLEQQTLAGTFSTASSVQAGEPPLFSRDDILVTEKGTLNEHDSNVGNVLSVFRAN